MAAFDAPVSLDMIGKVVKLPHGQFLELIRRCESLGWIHEDDGGFFCLSNNLPDDVKLKFEKINSEGKLAKIVDKLKSDNKIDELPQTAPNKTLHKIEENRISIKNEIALALNALKKNEKDVAGKHVNQIDLLLSPIEETSPDAVWFIQAAIRLSEYCILRSVGLSTVIRMLEMTISMAEKIGDKRSWTRATLLLGRIYWLQNRLDDAVTYLEKGKEKAEYLGDSDILTYAALFIGLYYYILGYLNKAAGYLNIVRQSAHIDETTILAYEAPILLMYCDINRGDFYRAIGTIDFFHKFAIKQRDYYTASLYRANLGTCLWVAGKIEEAVYHLEGSQSDALAANNIVSYWISLNGLACLYFSEGKIDKGLGIFKKGLQAANQVGNANQIFHPLYLESYYAADQAGAKLPEEWRFGALFERIMSESNIDLQGTALRLRAMRSVAGGKDENSILNDLQLSEALLIKCEDRFQLAKTRIELVRFYLRNDNYETARNLAYDVYKELTGYHELSFPDDLEFLLEGVKIEQAAFADYGSSLEPILRILEEILSGPDNPRKMELFLSTLSRFFRAERSGIFVFEGHKVKFPALRVARNLSRSLIDDQIFRQSMNMIVASYRQKKPISTGDEANKKTLSKSSISAICIPLLSEKGVKAVLYFDNSYLPNFFAFIERPLLQMLTARLSEIVEKQEIGIIEAAEKSKSSSREQATPAVLSDFPDFVVKDSKMLKLLNQARRYAESEAPILIMGETGVGKEIVAHWIHENSSRKSKPFVVVDISTIPENLMESELFGHEKGAFTGAHLQKIGRVELSKGGTLFLDEIGEISLPIQVKLLRLLEKKTFVSIGGRATKEADFRLLAATNRNLMDDVKAGRFREDLYYRLNRLEVLIPPLNQRKEDILALADNFIAYFSRKYNKKKLMLSEEQKTAMLNYKWPGNVRELRNVIERAVLVTDRDRLELDFSDKTEQLTADNPFSDLPTLDELQRRYIRFVLKHTSGQIGGKGGAAEILNMKRTSVNSRMKQLGMR